MVGIDRGWGAVVIPECLRIALVSTVHTVSITAIVRAMTIAYVTAIVDIIATVVTLVGISIVSVLSWSHDDPAVVVRVVGYLLLIRLSEPHLARREDVPTFRYGIFKDFFPVDTVDIILDQHASDEFLEQRTNLRSFRNLDVFFIEHVNELSDGLGFEWATSVYHLEQNHT